MRKFLARGVLVMTVIGCCLTLGCQGRSPKRDAALALVKAIQADDRKLAKELAQYHWVPILEFEERLHIGNQFYLPIHVAAQEGRAAIMEELIRLDADVDARTDDGFSPVMYLYEGDDAAGNAGRLECLRLLARKGANLNARSRSSRQAPLHKAADFGYVELTRELVKLGADVRVRMCEGSTPLHVACRAHKPATAPEPVEIAEILIKAGADVTAKNDAGQTPEDIAREKGREKLVALLKEAAKAPAKKKP